MTRLQNLRDDIDRVDTVLLRLLNLRASLSCEVGLLKSELGLPAYCAERERAILGRVSGQTDGPLDPVAVHRLFRQILRESRRAAAAVVEEYGSERRAG